MLCSFSFAIVLVTAAHARRTHCKLSPTDPNWPSAHEWSSLNTSIGGALIKTAPIASSCSSGNPFHSPLSCDQVRTMWNTTDFHASLPESVDSPVFANNSCLPPGFPGYFPDRGCTLGGLPQYVVNATIERQIATAVKWASQRDIRIIIKGTGHDLMGRSSGAFSLSIWTHTFRKLQFGCPPGLTTNVFCKDALVVGSGIRWREVYAAADKVGRAVVGGGDGSVGLGGHIQGGGHGPLSSTYGLAADQVLQATLVTTDGAILRANEFEHPDLLWAIRGGTGGLYGIVTEFVLRTYPAVGSVALGSLSISAADGTVASGEATWDAAAILVSKIPDLMDAGLTGTVYVANGLSAFAIDPSLPAPPPAGAVVISYRPFAYSTTTEALTSLLAPIVTTLSNLTSSSLIVTSSVPVQFPSFLSWFTEFGQASPAGTAGLVSSRLLRRTDLTTSVHRVRKDLQAVMAPQDATTGAVLIVTMTAGKGPARVPQSMRGALNPAWRDAYVHAIAATSAPDLQDESKTPQQALQVEAAWLEQHTQRAFKAWSPRSGAYINEANGFDRAWREDFYGKSYERLVSVKRRYDPSASLWVQGGIGNADWEYDLDSGRLCRRH